MRFAAWPLLLYFPLLGMAQNELPPFYLNEIIVIPDDDSVIIRPGFYGVDHDKKLIQEVLFNKRTGYREKVWPEKISVRQRILFIIYQEMHGLLKPL